MRGRWVRVFHVVWFAGFSGIAGSGLAQQAQADARNEESSEFSLRGFGTVGISRSSSPHAGYVRDLSQPRGIRGGEWSGRVDNVLGLQANWQATSQLEFVGQAVSRYRYDRSRDPEVMWAFARWEPDARFGFRLGRIGADFMMAADSRLVGYSSLPAHPSHDFFGPLFFSHLDGADVTVRWPVADGVLRGNVFSGTTREKTSGTPGIWDTSGSPVGGWVVDYFTGPWQLRANRAHIRFSHDIKLSPLPDLLRTAGTATGVSAAFEAADALGTRGTTSRFDSLGVIYDEGPLQVQGMLNRIHHESGVFQNSHAGYVLAGYRIGTITPYAGFSRWKSRYKPYTTGLPEAGAFAGLNQTFASLMRASGVDQKTYTVGVRWDVLPQAALKLQWDAIRGKDGSVFAFTPVDADWNGRTDVLSVVLDFIF